MSKLKKSKFTVKEIPVGKTGHQGDVFMQKLNTTFEDFSNIIKSATKLEPNHLNMTIVLRGEGVNYHALPSDVAEVYEVPSNIPGIQRFIANIVKETQLQHIDDVKEALSGEHNTMVLSPGIYEFRSQRQLGLREEDLNKLAEERIQRVTD